MSRRSDYFASHGTGYENAAYLNFDRHHNDPRHRRSDPENVPFNRRLPRNQSDNFLSERHDSRLTERTSRGYNPPYYGTPSSVAGSDPGRDDFGFEFENPDTARFTPIGDGYNSYKKHGEVSDRLTELYSQRLKSIGPPPPRKQQHEAYFGSPSITRGHHREMYGLASSIADAADLHSEARAQFDQDYRHHYHAPEDRAGHLKKIKNERARMNNFRQKESNHGRWL